MKKNFYLAAFTFLGFLCQFLIHAVLEIWYIKLLLLDFNRYGFGWSWTTWYHIHATATWVLIILGLVLGYVLGKYGWGKVYESSRKNNFSK